MSLTFGRRVRLRSRVEFDHVQRAGRRVSARYLTLVGRRNSLDRDRLGIIASRRVGGAVERNRAKRRLRELFRHQHPEAAAESGRAAFDVVVIARPELADAPFAAVEADFCDALRRLRGTR
jgi:ribonuclease P protein component